MEMKKREPEVRERSKIKFSLAAFAWSHLGLGMQVSPW